MLSTVSTPLAEFASLWHESWSKEPQLGQPLSLNVLVYSLSFGVPHLSLGNPSPSISTLLAFQLFSLAYGLNYGALKSIGKTRTLQIPLFTNG